MDHFTLEEYRAAHRKNEPEATLKDKEKELHNAIEDRFKHATHLVCTNCGPLGLEGNQEPSTNRAALSGRSWAHIVHSNDDHEVGDVDFGARQDTGKGGVKTFLVPQTKVEAAALRADDAFAPST
jgi:hypothetical protein